MRKKLLSVILVIALAIPLFALPASANTAKLPLTINFDNGEIGGFKGRDWTDTKVELTTEQKRSGTHSLLVTGRTEGWHGAQVSIAGLVEADVLYEVSIWARLKSGDPVEIHINAIIPSFNPNHKFITRKGANKNNWTEVKESISFTKAEAADEGLSIAIQCDNPTLEFYIDDFLLKVNTVTEQYRTAAKLPSIRETYKDYFLMGQVFNTGQLNSDAEKNIYLPFFIHHYNSLTAEWEMKPSLFTTVKREYDFSKIDKSLSVIGKETVIHGHTLLWHMSHAEWLTNNANGTPLTRAQAKANMEAYINKVAGHYAEQVYSWDVINEAFNDGRDYQGTYSGDWRSALRSYKGEWTIGSPWYVAYANGAKTGESGADYIYDAYVFARLAAPDAILYYNDFFQHDGDFIKAQASADMIKELNEQWAKDPRNKDKNRKLIEGMGDQSHWHLWNFDINNIEKILKLFIDLDVKISISELDILTYQPKWTLEDGFSFEDKPLTVTLEKQQAEAYAKLFQLYKKYSKNIERVTFWGIDDENSGFGGGYPHLFNADMTPKLAYFAVIDPEGYLAGDFDTAQKRSAWIEENSIQVYIYTTADALAILKAVADGDNSKGTTANALEILRAVVNN